MTFSTQCKLEIAYAPANDCCNAAFVYGLLAFSRSFPVEILLSSESGELIDQLESRVVAFGLSAQDVVKNHSKGNWQLKIASKDAIDRILLDFGYSGAEPNIRIKDTNFMCDNCVAAFISGCFIAGGSITDPKVGYHLEFSSHKKKFFEDFEQLLRNAAFEPRNSNRGYSRILYFKDSTQIEDMLTYMGAAGASMEIMDLKIGKEIRNTVNRRINCESANIDKTISAAMGDVEIIRLIERAKGLDDLAPELREMAKLRCEFPELSLSELGQLSADKLTKSGVSHRLRRIRVIAQNIKEKRDA